jgi:transposase
MAKPRKFSPEFKAKIALAALRGEATTAELCRKHQLSDTLVARWKQQLLKQAHCIFSAATPDDAQRQRIDDLERLIGQLTVELDAAKKLSAMLH